MKMKNLILFVMIFCTSEMITAAKSTITYESSFSVGRQIQSQINKVVLEIPGLIELTKKKVMESRQTFNYRKVAGATGIALGKLIQNYAADLNTQPMTYGRIFNDIGGVLVNGGYSGFRIATLKLDEINCGIGEFNKVLEEYGILFSLQDVDEKYISEALIQGYHPLKFIPGELMPESLEFTLEDFQNMLKSGLSCIVNESEASELNFEIRRLIEYLQILLNFRANLFKMINKDFDVLI